MHQLKKAYLEITNVCNLNCSFCPGTRRPGRFMTPEQFQILAARIRPHTQYLYLHLMGEPLLHPDLDKLLNEAQALGFRAMLTTNGTLLERRIPLLRDSPAVEKVSISVHALEGNGCGGLEEYLEGCIRATRAFSTAGKRCALRLWNLEDGKERATSPHNETILATLRRQFPKPWKRERRGTVLAPGIFLELGERFDWPDLRAPEQTGRRFCYGLRDHVGVLCDGTVVPCCLDHEGDIPLGNLFQQPLEEILNTPRARAIYDGFSRGQASEGLCRRCGFIRRFQ